MQCLLRTCTMIDKMLTRWWWTWEKVGKTMGNEGGKDVLLSGVFWIGRYRAYGWSPRHVWHIHIHDYYQGSVSCTKNIRFSYSIPCTNTWSFTPYHAQIYDNFTPYHAQIYDNFTPYHVQIHDYLLLTMYKMYDYELRPLAKTNLWGIG